MHIKHWLSVGAIALFAVAIAQSHKVPFTGNKNG